jgi:hypothetical protein
VDVAVPFERPTVPSTAPPTAMTVSVCQLSLAGPGVSLAGRSAAGMLSGVSAVVVSDRERAR